MKHWTGIASIGAAVTIGAALLVLVPNEKWTSNFVLGVVLLACSLLAPALLPRPRPHTSTDDATSVWLIGPLAALFVALFALAAGDVCLALFGHAKASLVASILWGGLLVVGYSAFSASTRVVAAASSQTALGKDDARSNWVATVRRVSAMSEDEPIRELLSALAERIRYAANDRGTQEAAENQAIGSLVGQLEMSAAQITSLQRLVRAMEALLEQRESSLRAARSRA